MMLGAIAKFGLPIVGSFDRGQRWDNFRTMFDLGTAMGGPQAYLAGQILLGRDNNTAAGTLDDAAARGLLKPNNNPDNKPVKQNNLPNAEDNQFLRKPEGIGQPAKDDLPALTPLQERAYQAEASRLAQQAATDPYYKMNDLYRSAQQNLNLEGAAGADNRMAVEQLGLAIHAAKYGDPNPRGLSARTGQDTGGSLVTRDQASREQAMNLAAETVNQLLNPQENKALNAQMFTPGQSQGARGQAGFNTSATFDLGAVRPAITDMQVNLNPMVANRSGEEGFMFDKNILDEKKLAAYQLRDPRKFV